MRVGFHRFDGAWANEIQSPAVAEVPNAHSVTDSAGYCISRRKSQTASRTPILCSTETDGVAPTNPCATNEQCSDSAKSHTVALSIKTRTGVCLTAAKAGFLSSPGPGAGKGHASHLPGDAGSCLCAESAQSRSGNASNPGANSAKADAASGSAT